MVGKASVVSKDEGALVDEGFQRGGNGNVPSGEGEQFCVNSGGSDDDLVEGSCDATVGSGRSWGSRREGVADTEVGMDRGERFRWGNRSSWGAPFDLVVVDMASLGGLDFAQKLVRRKCFKNRLYFFYNNGEDVELKCICNFVLNISLIKNALTKAAPKGSKMH